MELRLYSFVNLYLSDMQKGIQTGHMAVDLVREYMPEPGESVDTQQAMVASWADNYKTFIVLNGGNNAGLEEITNTISIVGLPWTSFYEDEQSLGGIQTCAGVVVPENYFKAKISTENTFHGHLCTTIEIPEVDGVPGFYLYGDNPIIEDTVNTPGQTALFKFIKLIRTARLA